MANGKSRAKKAKQWKAAKTEAEPELKYADLTYLGQIV